MAISYINTDEVEKISRELFTLTDELSNEIDQLFNKFSEVPYVTKEWVGQQSIYYFNKVSLDRKQYKNYISKLYEITNKLNKDVYDFKLCTNTNLKEEADI